MKLIILIALAGLTALIMFAGKALLRKQRRRGLLRTPFSSDWDSTLKENLPPYVKLAPPLRQQLQDAIRIFIAEKSTMHEFAHQLDQDDGKADGAPVLAHRSAYSAWARVFSEEYVRLKRKKARGQKSMLDAYGATNPAEFFAVATETFFEKPGQLKSRHPELYEELHDFYKVSPVDWQ